MHPCRCIRPGGRAQSPPPTRPSVSEETVTHTDHADRPLSVEQRIVGGTRVVSLRGQIDYDAKQVLSDALRTDTDASPTRIVADLGEVTFMDSSGINILIATHRQVSGAGGWVRIAAAQEAVLGVLQLVGIDALIPCYPTVEHALAS
ncbi:STAS domain-containing protein [Streptomyces lasalocidi]|uniref:Anti-sigma factor antagonist n=1 Tax=Streptomyces lasalocidi TaxID=324833 RepID=A0A4U5WNS4_STRLS|nr:STAS domain-containing protein [Streptomyces lasalocidi]